MRALPAIRFPARLRAPHDRHLFDFAPTAPLLPVLPGFLPVRAAYGPVGYAGVTHPLDVQGGHGQAGGGVPRHILAGGGTGGALRLISGQPEAVAPVGMWWAGAN